MLTLRDVILDDVNIITIWKNNDYIITMANDYSYSTTTKEQLQDIKKSIANEYSLYKVILYNNDPIGYIRIDWLNDDKNYGWLRLVIGKYRNKGYGYKATYQLITELFNEGMYRLEGEVYDYNIASQKLLNKLNFKKEGIKRKAHFDGKKYVDVYVYGLLKEDFVGGN